MAAHKILNHPDKEEIIQRLISGESPNKVSGWLTSKYPDEEQYQITVVSLNEFRKKHLNINREVARVLKQENKKKLLGIPHNPNAGAFLPQDESEKEHHMRVKKTLFNSPTYQEKLKEITDAHLDAPRLLKELHALLSSRIEVYYNEIASASSIGETLRADKMFVDYIRLATDVLKDAKKVWDDYNSIPDEGTIDLDIVHDMVGAVRETVKELLQDFSPELALDFMDRLSKRMMNLKYNIPEAPSDMIQKVESLNKKIKQIQKEKELSNE